MKTPLSAFAIVGLLFIVVLLSWHSDRLMTQRDSAVKERNSATKRVSELETREQELQTSLANREDSLREFQRKFEKAQEGITNATPNECTDVAVAPDIDRQLREQTGAASPMQLPRSTKGGVEAARYSEVGRWHEPRLGIARFQSDQSCAGMRSRQENHS